MTLFARWGRFVYRWRVAMLVLSGLLLAASIVLILQGGQLRSEGSNPGEAFEAIRLINREIPPDRPQNPARAGWIIDVVFSSGSLSAADPAYRDAVLKSLAPIRSDPRVIEMRIPYDDYGLSTSAVVSRDGRSVLATVYVNGDRKAAQAAYLEFRSLIRSNRLQVLVTGNLATTTDFDRMLDGDLRRAEIFSVPLALILLLLVFGAVVAALLPLGVGLLALAGGVAGTFLLSRITNVSPYALNIVALIGLGVSIDYSLFILNRFREELNRGATVEDSLARTMATAGRAIAFSGLTVAIGLSGMLFYGKVFASVGMAGAIVVAVSVFYALTFLPALLGVLGSGVNRWRLPFAQRRSGRQVWHRIATSVMRRPLLVLLPTVGFILLAGSPFLSIRLANADATALPPTVESRRGQELLERDFPGYNETNIVVVAYFAPGRPLSPDHVGALYDLSRRIAKLPDVVRMQGPVDVDPSLDRSGYQRLYADPTNLAPRIQAVLRGSVGEHIAVLSAVTTQPPESDAARAIVRAIRAGPPLEGGRTLVTGQTAADLDIVDFTLKRTPPAIAYVMVVTYLVLFLLLGSVLLPLKAVVMNLLSLTASFGAMVWIFQQGHLRSQLNFTPASIDPVLPVIVFCIVFGLSMDYEVFLLSRIQEEYKGTGDNTRAVAEGLERSGRLVTGAAAVMVAVFSAFAIGDIVLVKSVGLAMLMAVAIDATIVRALMVPATMRLLGRLNWWAPSPIARLNRRLTLGEQPIPDP
jgi:RND superfamily putative drug exporter